MNNIDELIESGKKLQLAAQKNGDWEDSVCNWNDKVRDTLRQERGSVFVITYFLPPYYYSGRGVEYFNELLDDVVERLKELKL